MSFDQGNLYVLRPETDSSQQPDSDLMDLAHSLSQTKRRDLRARPRATILAISADASRYRIEELESVDVNWVVVESPMEALDHLLHRGDSIAAVLTEIQLQGRDNGYRVIEACRAYGYDGPILVVSAREPLASERGLVKRRGATGTVVFQSERMLHMLHSIAAGIVPLSDAVHVDVDLSFSGPQRYPEWVPHVIKHLARYLGPSAGDAVRKLFVDMYARNSTAPGRQALVDEAAELLVEWPEDRARFIVASKGARRGAT